MSTTRHTILASRPAAFILALSLVGGLSLPFVMLPRAGAATAPLACAENNNNGCTELSPTPPEVTVAVPPNIMLMLDDSGSMTWDIMPDYGSLSDTSDAALVNSDVNGVYYNPAVTYAPPPQVDGTPYPQASFSAALLSGFDTSGNTVDLSTYRGAYDSYNANYVGTPVQYSISMPLKGATTYSPASSCPKNTSISSGAQPGYCAFSDTNNPPAVPFNFFATSGYFYVSRCKSISDVYTYSKKNDFCTPGRSFFTYTTTNSGGGYTRHYVAKNTGDCAAAGLSSTVCDESTATRQNVANWFSYSHTRILMAKSGLMTAFDKLSPNYRFGFGSINGGNNGALPSPTGTFGSNTLAEVQPFGDGSTGTQRAGFWSWISTMTPPHQSTPLRKALQSVGKYYQDAQPWKTMSSDPGYTAGGTTKFACRASYAILTTDGFWNGPDPSVTAGTANKDGPKYAPPAGKTYTVTQYKGVVPFSGGVAVDRYGNSIPSLTDVATYYWETDLQPSIADEVAPTSADPAFWQHMTTFTLGLGVDPRGISPNGTTVDQIFAWAKGGTAIPGFSWPTPSSDSIYNIADLAHAAVNGHGDFFSVKSPQELAAAFAKFISDVNNPPVLPTPASVNASVLAVGAIAFRSGYSTSDWSGVFDAAALKNDGSPGIVVWTPDAGTQLNADFHSTTGYTTRKVYTNSYKVSGGIGTFNAFQLTAANSGSLDATETAGLQTPALLSNTSDTLSNRISYLLGDTTNEGLYRTRTSILGAIIHAEPVYVKGATGNYFASWPTFGGIDPPEAATGAQTYDDFTTQQAANPGTVYLAANDGMLHAFSAPVPTCTGTLDSSGNCTAYSFASGATPGKETWAFVPRAVYANLGNLTVAQDFQYRPTVDATPVTRDVFFSGGGSGDKKWHTILAGGVGLGGRGVYALDITNPALFQAPTITSYPASGVLWEFDSDMTDKAAGCVSIVGTSQRGTCSTTDLGYTVSKPNIGRLSDGKWVVIVPNGYFPDCSTPDTPTNDSTNCQAIAAQAPKDSSGKSYSALFVLDAQSGALIAELKTPNITGVTSFGLSTPVMGDYESDQVDDVAFAGDVQGNLWRFDLRDTTTANWTVTLVYKGLADVSGNQGLQPITTMPRLFPDPVTNRFMVVFGTGKFLGVGDNSSTGVQAVYGVRDVAGTTYSQGDLTHQYLHETTIPAGATLPDGSPDPLAGASLRCVTGGSGDTCDAATAVNSIPGSGAGSGGWVIDLKTTDSDGTQNNAGERVVVNPGAIFASNTVVFETLITGAQSSDPCSPSTQGAILALNAVSGGPAGVSSLGGWPIAGGRIGNARTSGSLPLVSALGGGQAYLPGATLAPKNAVSLSIDAPIWRRRSWQGIQQN